MPSPQSPFRFRSRITRMRVTRRSRLTRAIHLALALLFFAHQSAWAATISVGGACTLVDAITAANTDAPTGSCSAGSGPDTLALSADVILTAVNNMTNGPNGLPSITTDITVSGAGHTVSRSIGGGTPDFRLFHIESSGTLTLEDLTVSNGRTEHEAGGALLNRGSMILTNTTLSNNSALEGGAVYNWGGASAIFTNTTISSNSAEQSGGGVSMNGIASFTNTTVADNVAGWSGGGLRNSGSATLESTTVSGNSADDGGGIDNSSTLTLVNTTVSGNSAQNGGGLASSGSAVLVNPRIIDNSATFNGGGIESFFVAIVEITGGTISGNSAGARGGGLANSASAVLSNTTVSGNSAQYGGGLYSDFLATTTAANSTIAANSASNAGGGVFVYGLSNTMITNSLVASSSGGNCSGTLLDGGNNLADDTSCGAVPGTLTGLDAVLANNGGPTKTHALLPGSNAIDAAGSCGQATDQRGAPRPGGACDSGAFEVQPPSCGSGFVDHGEQCDDGNASDGDCCSASCQFQPALGVGGTPNCCSMGVCQTGAACGAICFAPGAICRQDGGPGTACTCELP